jgi:hypothetical protein
MKKGVNMSKTRAYCCALGIVGLAWIAASTATAQPSDKRTYFTFSGPVEVPGVALPPGKYLFRVVDSGGRVVQVLSEDGSKPYAMFFSLPAERLTPASEPEVRFMETPAGTPPAIKTWWYPGETIGREFIYPKEQAQRLAKRSTEPVLTTQQQTTTTEQTNTGELSRVAASGSETVVNAESKPAATTPTGTAQQGETAPGSIIIPPASVPTASNSTSSSAKAFATSGTPAKGSRKRLPQTASLLPIAGLLGVCLIAGAASIRLWRSVHR